MSRDTEQELDALLRSRPIVPASDNLSSRIIEAARLREQHHDKNIVHWLHRLFKDVLHLEPAYVIVLTLILGLGQGYFITDVLQDAQTESSQVPLVQDFFYSERSNQ